MTVPWLRRLVAGLSPQRFGFFCRKVNVGFVVDEMALSQVSFRVLLFSSASIVPSALYTHLSPTIWSYQHPICICLQTVIEVLGRRRKNCLSSCPHSCTVSVTTNYPNPCCTVLQKLLVSHLFKESFAFYGTRKLTTVFTRSLHLSVS
jgi:hypothetical protein